MEPEKPKAIKTIGIAIMAVSAMIIFSNGMGGLAWTLVGFGEGEQSSHGIETPFSFIMSRYVELCLFMVAIGILYLPGGYFLQKYKLWANRLVTIISGALILVVWTVMIVMRSTFGHEPELEILNTFTVAIAIFWTLPLALLIWYLNRKDIARHFA